MPELGWGLLEHQKSSNRSKNMGNELRITLRSGHLVQYCIQTRTYLSFFNALKGPNAAQACPKQSVKFW